VKTAFSTTRSNKGNVRARDVYTTPNRRRGRNELKGTEIETVGMGLDYVCIYLHRRG
jgi:hypothetical protein